tara:strand:- start:884 stop:1642 length:759 start_codon:yes stop_codon:yes gene_type:complete
MSKIKFFLSKNKEQIRYKLIQGKKPLTIVFLHGFMSDLKGKKIQVLAKLCAKQKVSFLAFEYSGHGKSSGQLSDYGIGDWIEQSKEIIEKITKNKKIILVGSSMGAWIAIALISKLKKNIKAFVGIASAPDFTKEIMWRGFSKKVRLLINSGKIHYMPSSYGSSYPISKKLILDGNKNLVLKRKIICNFPIRLFHGLKDKVVAVSFSIQLSKTLLSKDIVVNLQKYGEHSLSHKEDLKKIKNELANLIKNSR